MLADRPDLVRETLRAALPDVEASLSEAIRAGVATFREAGGERAYFGRPAAASGDSHGGSASADTAARIRAAMRHLPPDLGALVSLHYGEGLSVADLAAVMEVPAGTIKSRLHGARAQLRAILERSES